MQRLIVLRTNQARQLALFIYGTLPAMAPKKIEQKLLIMNERLLPNQYKKIAFITGTIGIIAFILKFPLGDFVQLEQARIEWILLDIILISLLIITFSKDKNETQKIKDLRVQELRGAVIFGGFLLIVQSIQEIIFWDGHHKIEDGFEIMVAILLYYIVVFNIKKYK